MTDTAKHREQCVYTCVLYNIWYSQTTA